jgi:hypothetical protein
VKYGAFAYLLRLSRVGGLIVGAAMSRLNDGHPYPFVSDLTKIADLVCEMDHTLAAGRLPDPVYAVTHRRHARLANSRDGPQPVRCRQHEACGPHGPAGRLVLVINNCLARYFPEAGRGATPGTVLPPTPEDTWRMSSSARRSAAEAGPAYPPCNAKHMRGCSRGYSLTRLLHVRWQVGRRRDNRGPTRVLNRFLNVKSPPHCDTYSDK